MARAEPLSLWVPGNALSERKRNVRRGTFTRTVDTPDRADWKAYVKHCAAQACPEPFAAKVPLDVTLCFYRVKPESTPKRIRWPVTKPDMDNLVKPCFDAFKGVVWGDDAQVVQMAVVKRFSDAPGVRVEVRILDDLEA